MQIPAPTMDVHGLAFIALITIVMLEQKIINVSDEIDLNLNYWSIFIRENDRKLSRKENLKI